jgi:hypothetical protein
MPKYPGGVHFVRPFTPFTCGGKYGATEGCGPGTYVLTMSEKKMEWHFKILLNFQLEIKLCKLLLFFDAIFR